MKHYKEWKTITVFVSSTFLDMNAERDYIREKIRELEASYFKKHHILLKTIDLRWGVTTQGIDENDKESEILKVCFNEIKRSAPFFIALLGNRYGWIPPYEQIRLIMDALPEEDQAVLPDAMNKSVTHLEIELGALKYNPLLKNSLFFFRDESSYRPLAEEERGQFTDTGEKFENLVRLKKTIRARCEEDGWAEHCITYFPRWNGTRFADFEEIGQAVERMLVSSVDVSEYEEWEVKEEWIAANILEFDYFKQSADKNFGGYREEVEQLLPVPGNSVLLTGGDATGKSYMLAKVASEWQKRHPDGLMLYFQASGSPYGNGLTYLYHQFIFQSARFIGVNYSVEDAFSLDRLETLFSPFFKVVPKKLYLSRLKELLISIVTYIRQKGFSCAIVVDNLHLFEYGEFPPEHTGDIVYDGDTSLRLLRSSLFSQLSYLGESLVSCHSDFVNAVFNRFDKSRITLRELRSVTVREGVEIISNYLKGYGKTLYTDLMEDFMKSHDTLSPLHIFATAHLLLNMDSENFRRLKSLPGIDEEEKIKNYIGRLLKEQNDSNQLPGIYKELLNQAKRALGEEFVAQLVAFLAISYDGITERTLAELMGEVWDDLKFARFNLMLPFLLYSSGSEKKWGFKHKSIKIGMQVCHQNQIYSLSNKFMDFCYEHFSERIEDKSFLAEMFYIAYLRKNTMVAHVILTLPEKDLTFVYRLVASLMQWEKNSDFTMWLAHTMFNLTEEEKKGYMYCVVESLGNYLFRNGYYRACADLYETMAESSTYFLLPAELISLLYYKAIHYNTSACESSPHKWILMASRFGDDKMKNYLSHIMNGMYHELIQPVTKEMLAQALDDPDQCNHYIYRLYRQEEYERCLVFALEAARKHDACKASMVMYGGYKYGPLVGLDELVNQYIVQCKDAPEAYPLKLAYAYHLYKEGEFVRAMDELASPGIEMLRPANYLRGLILERAGLWSEALQCYLLADSGKPFAPFNIYEEIFMDMQGESYEEVYVAPVYRIAVHYIGENKYSKSGLEYLLKAARNGHEEAIFKLSEYLDPRSYLYTKMLENSANHRIYGNSAAQKLLGAYFEDEKWCAMLPEASVYWYERAALNGDRKSISHLEKLFAGVGNLLLAEFWKEYAETINRSE